ncbi:MAG: hypothetical protein ACI33M_08525 [Lysinibacillus sp.]
MMTVDFLAKCKEKKKQIENTFYSMLAYSDDIPALEKLSDELIDLELTIIRMEKLNFDRMEGRCRVC